MDMPPQTFRLSQASKPARSPQRLARKQPQHVILGGQLGRQKRRHMLTSWSGALSWRQTCRASITPSSMPESSCASGMMSWRRREVRSSTLWPSVTTTSKSVSAWWHSLRRRGELSSRQSG